MVITQQSSWYTEDGDTDYLYQVLRHEPTELSLNDKVAFRYVFLSYLYAAILGFLATWIGEIVGYVIDGPDNTRGIAILETLFGVGTFLLVYLCAKVNEPLGEWKVMLADRARSSESVYAAITGVIAHRQLPVQVVARRMIDDTRTGTIANRLIIKHSVYTVVVAVFPYGTGLYLSWRMWRRRSGFQLLMRFLFDIVGVVFRATDIVAVMQRTDLPRAMREAVHSACREGLKVAVNATMVNLQFGFPSGLPPVEGYTQDTESFGAPMPPFIPAAPQYVTPQPAWPALPPLPPQPPQDADLNGRSA